MKFLSGPFSILFRERSTRRNFNYFFRFIIALTLVTLIFSLLFHYIMEYEGRSYSWMTGLYWTLTVMSTLGFGDITFSSDLGKAFSIIVLLTGIVSLLIVFPSIFIQFVYTPWLEAQKKREIKHSLPASVHGHILIIGISPVTRNLSQMLSRYGFHSFLLCSSAPQAMELMDQGLDAVVGDYDDVEVYRNLRANMARMVIALDTDVRNTNVAFTLREFAQQVPMVASAEKNDSLDILRMAGCTQVFQFQKSLGRALTRRVMTGKLRVSQLAAFGPLIIAEASVRQTTLEGVTLRQSHLRSDLGINVVGLWNDGKFSLPDPDCLLTERTVLVMAGTRAQMDAFVRTVPRSRKTDASGPVLVLGGGRVGAESARALKETGLDVVVVDKIDVSHQLPGIKVQTGDATDPAVLEKAGVSTAPSIIITMHDDDINIYLAMYCRRIRPDVQIISRTNLDRNVRVLHTAGANVVLSLASLVANHIINLLEPGRVFMLNEGLNIFRVPAGSKLSGKTLISSGIREHTRCSVVAVQSAGGEMLVNPDPNREFKDNDEVFLIGDANAESAYYQAYWPERNRTEQLPPAGISAAKD